MEPQVGDVRSDFPKRNHPAKLTTQYIWGNPMLLCFLHDHLVRILPSYLCEQIVFVHKPEHFLVVHAHFSFSKYHNHGSVSVFSLGFR